MASVVFLIKVGKRCWDSVKHKVDYFEGFIFHYFRVWLMYYIFLTLLLLDNVCVNKYQRISLNNGRYYSILKPHSANQLLTIYRNLKSYSLTILKSKNLLFISIINPPTVTKTLQTLPTPSLLIFKWPLKKFQSLLTKTTKSASSKAPFTTIV